MKVAFLILHYNEISLTQKAISSIMDMDVSKEDRPIIIVDNCSLNGSGKKLTEVYEAKVIDESDAADEDKALQNNTEVQNAQAYINEKENIHIILNTENSGFARGNNLGYRYIKENMHVDFVIALNNDISFPQKDFIQILTSLYENEKEDKRFYLAGPDVWTPNIRSHISPLDANYKDEEDVLKRFDLISHEQETYRRRFSLATFVRFLQDKYQGTRLLNLYNSLRKGEYDGACPHNLPAYNCVLNGACLIFDKRYIEEWDYLFDEVTFLYAEEDFLTYRLIQAEKVIRYCPELRVNHVGQGSSSFGGMNYRKYCEKNINTQERCKESFEKYLKYIQSSKI